MPKASIKIDGGISRNLWLVTAGRTQRESRREDGQSHLHVSR
jgi:hypothetical protein